MDDHTLPGAPVLRGIELAKGPARDGHLDFLFLHLSNGGKGALGTRRQCKEKEKRDHGRSHVILLWKHVFDGAALSLGLVHGSNHAAPGDARLGVVVVGGYAV